MQRTQILLETEQHQELKEIARREGRSLAEVIRVMLDTQLEEYRKRVMEDAAQALLDDYQNDPELTAFQTLDGEEFHEEG